MTPPINNTKWVLLDTETTGFKRPVFALEIAAQTMCGWQAVGEPFRQLLNHDAAIPPEASRTNGYTREILERDGNPPSEVHEALRQYVADAPLVTYNLNYDLNQVLTPEWQRLGIAPIGRRGFCALELTRRLLDPVAAGNCKLQTLRQFYRLSERGTNTALDDVQTVIDLLQQVLQPLADQRELNTWQAVVDFCQQPWYPSRLAFGKYKGCDFREARSHQALKDWLEWLASSNNERSQAMGKWYLTQLEALAEFIALDPSSTPTSSPSNVTSLTVYGTQRKQELEALINNLRNRLAELEAQYTTDKNAVDALKAKLFLQVSHYHHKRNKLQQIVYYRSQYLDVLMQQGMEEAESLNEPFQQEQEQAEQEQEQAEQAASGKKNLTDEQKKAIKPLWNKLIRLFHPDRHHNDPEKMETYQKLMAVINHARDEGDLALLEEIAANPEQFIQQQGWQTIELGEESNLHALEQMYQSLQIRLLELIEALQTLHESSDYELLKLYEKDPDILQQIAAEQQQALEQQIAELQAQADKLKEEIEQLEPEASIIGDE